MKNRTRAIKSRANKIVVGQVRSGDVLLNPVDAIPADAKDEGIHNDYVLAIGEATGHSHVLVGDVHVWSVGKQKYVQVLTTQDVVHEEHKVVPVKSNVKFEVIQEKTLNLEGQWEEVSD